MEENRLRPLTEFEFRVFIVLKGICIDASFGEETQDRASNLET